MRIKIGKKKSKILPKEQNISMSLTIWNNKILNRNTYFFFSSEEKRDDRSGKKLTKIIISVKIWMPSCIDYAPNYCATTSGDILILWEYFEIIAISKKKKNCQTITKCSRNIMRISYSDFITLFLLFYFYFLILKILWNIFIHIQNIFESIT